MPRIVARGASEIADVEHAVEPGLLEQRERRAGLALSWSSVPARSARRRQAISAAMPLCERLVTARMSSTIVRGSSRLSSPPTIAMSAAAAAASSLPCGLRT